MIFKHWLFLALILVLWTTLLVGCDAGQAQLEPTAEPPAATNQSETAATATPVPPTPTTEPDSPEPQTPEEAPTEVPTEVPTVAPVQQTSSEQTEVATAAPDAGAADDSMIGVADLSIGSPGRYVNVAYGYIVKYPESWYTGFGNRPLLASFSNLDPGTTNRENMRATGCLFETNVSPNVYGSTLQTLMAQLPQTYENAEMFSLGGVEAVRLRFDNPNQPYVNELIQVIVDGRLFAITGDMARNALDTCQPAWADLLANWTWFEPDFITYRNTAYGYSISHPRRWFVSEVTEEGQVISSQDPAGAASADDLALNGMVVRTTVLENPELLRLKQWVVSNVPELGLTNDIQLDMLVGVRSIADWPDGTQKMVGYFQGPLGKIYVVSCTYPAERQREFRPIANAILYSFGF